MWKTQIQFPPLFAGVEATVYEEGSPVLQEKALAIDLWVVTDMAIS